MIIGNFSNGLVFRKGGRDFIVSITEDQLIKVICHAMEPHAVTSAGGFHAGQGSITSGGVAIGKNAKTVSSDGEWINAIQLGNGTNSIPETFKVYEYLLLDEHGKIPQERLPSSITGISDTKGVLKTSNVSVNVIPTIHTYLAETNNYNNVTFLLPNPETVRGILFNFRLLSQSAGFAMSIERTGMTHINVNGEEWIGITSDVLGFWVSMISVGSEYCIVGDNGISEVNRIE